MRAVLTAVLVPALAAAAAPAMAQASDPVARIIDYNRRLNAIEMSNASLAARTNRFVPVVQANYDMPAIAALVVGPRWSGTSAADKASAIAALTHHSAASLAKNFKGPVATAFKVDPRPIDKAGAKIVKVTAGSDTLFYRMGASGKIVDVISGGVSNLSLQRADLAATLASGGVPAMVRTLARLDSASK